MGITSVAALRRDATQPLSLASGGEFDAILVDAPCTGWGTIRRNPDIKWRTGPQTVGRMASLQTKLLGNLANLLRRGGRMVYSTCTVFEEENENLIEGFLRERGDFFLESMKSCLPDQTLFDTRGFFRAMPNRHHMDGFFAARVVRR